MKKHLLIIVCTAILSVSNVMAQTGSITITSLPTSVEAGSDLSVTVTYTSDVDCGLTASIFESNADGQTADWGKYVTHKEYTGLTAGTDVEYSFDLPIASNLNSANLASGINYLLALKLVAGSTEYGYNDVGNIIVVNPSTVVTNSIAFTSTPPAMLSPGEEVTINFEYTIAAGETNEIKVAITKYGEGYSWINGDLVVSYQGQKSETTSTPVTGSVTLTVPADAPLSADLTNGEFYTYDIGVYTTSWGYLTSAKSDLTIEESTGIEVINQAISVYPNPAINVIFIEGTEPGEIVTIYSATGALVKTVTATGTTTEIEIPELVKGMYLIKNQNNTVKFIKN